MKVLVFDQATFDKYDEQSGDDFAHAKQGDLLTFGSPCDAHLHSLAHKRHGRMMAVSSCGCDRAFVGLNSNATTIGTVAERDEAEVRKALEESQHYANWKAYISLDDLWADMTVLASMIDKFEVGRPVFVQEDVRSGETLVWTY